MKAQFLPSKKVIIVLIFTITIVVLFIIFNKKNPEYKDTIVINSNPILSTDRFNDFDDDGLLDWEELRWGTDPALADSDGDGTLDGEEVRKGRHPLITGPNDFIESGTKESELVEQKKIADQYEGGTVSDNVYQKLFTDYLTVGEDGNLGTLGEEEILKQIGLETSEEISFKEKYSAQDLQTFDSSSIESLTIFASTFAKLEMDKWTKLSQIPENTDSTDLIVNIYSNHSQALASIPVPDVLVDEHLAVVNGYSIFSQALVNLMDSQKDPIKGVVSMGVLEEVESDQSFAFSVMAEYFRERGIIFTDEDVEFLWNQF